MDELAEELSRSPELFPFALDLPGDGVAFIRLKKSEYEQASFLDARLLTPLTSQRPLAWMQLGAAIDAAQLDEHCGFIFHIGHVGSTLLSRLIGAHTGVFSLREPMILRTFAQLRDERAQPRARPDLDACIGMGLKLLSRTFETPQLAVIKATSFVSEIAAELLARPSTPKAVAMFVSPESYIATILGGPNSRQEAKLLAPGRLRRLHRRIGEAVWQLEDLSEGEVLALAWACEMSALAQAADSSGGRVFLVDFDRFLADPAALLLAVLRHFDIPAAATDVHAILEGPDMRRYSKAPEHAYDGALRREVLNQARALNAAEIRRGLAWLDRAAARFAPLRRAVVLAQ